MTARPRDQLRQAVEARRKELRLTMIQVDADANLAGNYYSKAICGTRTLSGTTLDKVLRALGVKILLVPDDSPEGIRARDQIFRSNRAKSCGQLRWAKTPKAERSEAGRKAVHARWAKARRLTAVRGAATRQKNQVARSIYEWLIWTGALEPPAGHGFLTGQGWAGVSGGMLKRVRRRADGAF